ncbi:hypothetical protein NKH18_39250 [Streptomyces sp. M10(2022)]
MGHQQLTTVGRGRHTGIHITIDMATRNLHTFRATLVHGPAVLRRYAEAGTGEGWGSREAADEFAVRLGRLAAEYRVSCWGGAPHPVPCRCHECLTLSPV